MPPDSAARRLCDLLASSKRNAVNHGSANCTLPGLAAGKKMLVPLTSSLYAPGTLAGSGTVLMDIGTGYFAEARFAAHAKGPSPRHP